MTTKKKPRHPLLDEDNWTPANDLSVPEEDDTYEDLTLGELRDLINPIGGDFE